MQVVVLLHRLPAGESARTIARAMGLARNTVGKYQEETPRLGLERQGAPPDDDQVPDQPPARWRPLMLSRTQR